MVSLPRRNLLSSSTSWTPSSCSPRQTKTSSMVPTRLPLPLARMSTRHTTSLATSPPTRRTPPTTGHLLLTVSRLVHWQLSAFYLESHRLHFWKPTRPSLRCRPTTVSSAAIDLVMSQTTTVAPPRHGTLTCLRSAATTTKVPCCESKRTLEPVSCSQAVDAFDFNARFPSHPPDLLANLTNPASGLPLWGKNDNGSPNPVPAALQSPNWVVSHAIMPKCKLGQEMTCYWCPVSTAENPNIVRNQGDTITSVAHWRWHAALRHRTVLPICTMGKLDPSKSNSPWTLVSSTFLALLPPRYWVTYSDYCIYPHEQYDRAVDVIRQLETVQGPFGLRDDVNWEGVDTSSLRVTVGGDPDRRFAVVFGPRGTIVRGFKCLMCLPKSTVPIFETLDPHSTVPGSQQPFAHTLKCCRTDMRDLKKAMATSVPRPLPGPRLLGGVSQPV